MNDEELRIAIERSRRLIVQKLGFDPRGGCDECPNHAYCHKHQRKLATMPCELSDLEAGVDWAKSDSKVIGNKLIRTKAA